MKTKEFTVYLSEYGLQKLEANEDEFVDVNRYKDSSDIKAKLIIEIPEKSVTITESEFNKAWHSVGLNGENNYVPQMFNEFKQKLFG